MAARITVNAIPQAVDLLLYQGDDFFLDVTVNNADGTPFTMTGWVPKAQIRPTPPDETVVAELTCTAASNVVSIHLLHVDSALLTEPLYAWDVQVTHTADGVVTTLCYGIVNMTLEVTR